MKCKYLENQICVRSDGQFRLCCVSVENENIENIKTHTIDDWHNSETHRKARELLEKNQWPDACKTCELHEEKGLVSQRTKPGEFGPGLSHMDIRFGNSCNLKCVTCFHQSSSSIAEEALQMSALGLTPLYPLLKEPHFNWASEETMKKFEGLPIREIYLTGGEPMMVKHLPNFLERLDSTVELRFNTNGTLWNKKIETILKRFRKVVMSLSLDAVDRKIEYIRYGSVWSEIETNIQKYAEFCKVDVTPTISILNACYYDEIIEYSAKNKFKIYENILNHPAWLDCKNAPDVLKSQFKAASINVWSNTTADENEIKNFKKNIATLDKFRKINIKDYLPEVAQAYYT
jgi:MoaA/NifB/PqqE/SkfB family radical SAM enzyme